MQQIDKAAKIIDLKGDFPRAVQVLNAILEHPEITNYPDIHVEVLAFMADLHMDMGRWQDAQLFLDRAENVDLSHYQSQATALSKHKLQRLKHQLDQNRPE